MVRRKFISILLLLLLCLLLSFAGCRSNINGNNDNKPDSPATSTPTPTASLVITDSPDNSTTELKSVNYYIVDPQTHELMVATAYVPAESALTPEQLMEFIIDSMADYFIIVDYDSVELDGKVMTVSLTEEIENIAEENETLETAILDAIAQSMLDNIADCSSVSFNIMGGPYHTVNRQFETGYIYMDK